MATLTVVPRPGVTGALKPCRSPLLAAGVPLSAMRAPTTTWPASESLRPGAMARESSRVTVSHGGPLTLIDGDPGEDDLQLAARIVARYSQGRGAESVELEYRDRDGQSRRLAVAPLPSEALDPAWIL